jgi:IS30 family transposase
LRRSLTEDQGAEMAEHAKLQVGIGLTVFLRPAKLWLPATTAGPP